MAITKKTRFEVFKRDSFTCQYCGRSAPDVILHVDHIQPVSKDGGDDILNLITSCVECNQGKKDRLLSDDTVIARRKRQLDELQERREQLDMMLEWQRSLVNLQDDEIEIAATLWKELSPGYTLNEPCLEHFGKLIRKFGISEVLTAIRTSCQQYYIRDADGKITRDSASKGYDYIGRICGINQLAKDRPYMRDIYYMRGILNRRFHYVSQHESIELMEHAVILGAEIDEIRDIVRTSRNWSTFKELMLDLIAELKQ